MASPEYEARQRQIDAKVERNMTSAKRQLKGCLFFAVLVALGLCWLAGYITARY